MCVIKRGSLVNSLTPCEDNFGTKQSIAFDKRIHIRCFPDRLQLITCFKPVVFHLSGVTLSLPLFIPFRF